MCRECDDLQALRGRGDWFVSDKHETPAAALVADFARLIHLDSNSEQGVIVMVI